jgi:hypothetical protein
MKDATKNILALIGVVFALVALCAPFAFVAFVVYSLIHYIIKFW